ncbi:hypothetical protein Tsubulata_513111 [Turnera subulata]|uniref:Receptor-like serine/threonine-protein kinase n=1 Tax=Turnera subulata TaxID=218843 RepID=A0A9Q0J3I2_9ROSI|nr:hypothetical protein Tsubulata_513111 [Turnera subulata]
MNPAKVFLVSLVIKFLLLQVSISKDTINTNELLADGETLVSSRQKFTLGFFTPGNSRNRYVGIWYTISGPMAESVVWVANREKPINDTSGVLSIDSKGNLVIYARNQTMNPIWSTNIVTVSSSMFTTSMAQLLDTGNLVLVGEDGTKSTVAWQSFDHPASMVLPGQKLGLDRGTGLNKILTSWKSQDDPATGEYSFWLVSLGCLEMFLYRGQVLWWRTGPWDGVKFNGVPEMTRHVIYTFSVVNNSHETSFTWGITDPTVTSSFYLDESGLINRGLWQDHDVKWVVFWAGPIVVCDYYGHCGPSSVCDPYNGGFECSCLPGFQPRSPNEWNSRDGTGGCVRKPGLQMCGHGDGFVKFEQAKLPDTTVARVDMSLDLQACELECLRDCSCMAYAVANISSGEGCTRWYGVLNDTGHFTYGGQDLYVRADASELAKYTKSSKGLLAKNGMLAVLVISLAVPFILVLCCLSWCMKRKRIDRSKDEFDEGLPCLDVHAISAATDNFSFSNKLGEGGFGSVYKGQLANGQEIAVKRLSATSRQGVEEFKNEVRLISKLQHKNLVRLYGCYIHGEEKMLIYEFLPNRSLNFFIFDETRRSTLDWSKRFEIILGIARGLLYLHQDSRLKIIHRDLKASNVLLDAAMNPKISDFGMAKIFGEDQTEDKTSRVMGTYGYMSPEYATHGRYSTKSDVFSYGVLMLEIISGRRNNDYVDEGPAMNLISHVWELWREGTPLDVVDPLLGQAFPTQEVLKCIQVGLLCVQENPADRPTMSATLSMLGNETALSSPRKPAFILETRHSNSDSSTPKTASVNNVSITVIEAR